MFFKLLTAIIVIIAAVFMLAGRRVLPPRGARRAPARVPRADDLVRCGRCGVWLLAGQGCDCAGPP
jgi:hypothetical protein